MIEDDDDDKSLASCPIKHEERVSLEEALNSLCHLCGYKLEWTAKILYNLNTDTNELSIISKCCGKTFRINPLLVETIIE